MTDVYLWGVPSKDDRSWRNGLGTKVMQSKPKGRRQSPEAVYRARGERMCLPSKLYGRQKDPWASLASQPV